MTDGSLKFDTKVDDTGFNQGTQNISKGFTQNINKMSSSFSKFCKTVVSFYLIKKAFDIGKESLEMASDLAEVQNVVDTAFEDMAYKCEAFANTAIKEFGMSKLAAKQAASTYMAMGKSMGLTMDSASDMAIQIAKLTGDVASFYNIEQDLAKVKLKGIYTGETEALKDLGVVMTQENLKQFAMTQGITKSIDAMTQAEKVALRYQFVMDALADAQGDFAKTSNSWANQTRVLSESWKELLGIIGNGLIQILTPVVQAINIVMQKLIDLANTIARVFGAKNDVVKQTQKQTKAIASSVKSEEELAEATKQAGKEADKSSASFDELNQLVSPDSSSDTTEGINISGIDETGIIEERTVELNVEANVDEKLQQAIKTIEKIFADVMKSMSNIWQKYGQPIWTRIRETFVNISEVLKLCWDNILQPIWLNFMNTVDWLWSNHLKPLLENFLNFISVLIAGILDIYNKCLLPICKGLTTLLAPAFVVVFNLIMDVVSTAVAFIADVLSGLMTILTGIIEFIVGVFTGDWEKAWGGVVKIFKGIWEGLVGIVKGVINLIIDVVNAMISALETSINNIIRMINRISIKNPFTDEDIWSPNVSEVSFRRVPKLATGTVVPSNYGEFTAILGDNKKEPEIVSPLSTMKQAFLEAFAESGMNRNNQSEVVLEINRRELGRVCLDLINTESKRRGVNLRSV